MPLDPEYRNVVLDLILSGTRYAGLHTALGELSGGSYARKPLRYERADDGKKVSSAPVRWPNCPQVTADNPISEVVIHDAATGGKRIWPLPVPEKKPFGKGPVEKKGRR